MHYTITSSKRTLKPFAYRDRITGQYPQLCDALLEAHMASACSKKQDNTVYVVVHRAATSSVISSVRFAKEA